MGILGLAKLIGDYAPSAVKENEIKNYFGRKIAIDASMSIYQFLIAVRQDGNVLTNADGEITSHLMGIFYRTIRMIENGIKPIYVFDGKPPHMKSGEAYAVYLSMVSVPKNVIPSYSRLICSSKTGKNYLAKRQERREEAQKNLSKAEEDGNVEDIDKFSRRLVKVTRQHNDECKQLLRLMGIPLVEAPCEAEAQCAALVKAGKAYGVATEDMDGLTFGANSLLRHLTASEARKMPIKEFTLSRVLVELGISQDQFVDLCILLGCDYCDSIRGIGPKRAVDLIRQHGDLEGIIKNLDKKKYTVPENWPYEEVRLLFKEPEVADLESMEIKWTDPDEEGIVTFLCGEKGFSEERVKNGVKKLLKGRTGQTQGRLDNFFKVIPDSGSLKRKPSETLATKKKAKTGGRGSGRKPK